MKYGDAIESRARETYNILVCILNHVPGLRSRAARKTIRKPTKSVVEEISDDEHDNERQGNQTRRIYLATNTMRVKLNQFAGAGVENT